MVLSCLGVLCRVVVVRRGCWIVLCGCLAHDLCMGCPQLYFVLLGLVLHDLAHVGVCCFCVLCFDVAGSCDCVVGVDRDCVCACNVYVWVLCVCLRIYTCVHCVLCGCGGLLCVGIL